MHLASFIAKDGARISKGDKIGVMGSTGKSTGAHTHLELRPKGTTYQSLDICEFTGIPNKVGTYSYFPAAPAEEAKVFVKQKCGFEDKTMEYLSQYKYADDLFIKLRNAMK
jgi:murein DD-endopeptidase MepM/ murein hydrolase activator NlpD